MPSTPNLFSNAAPDTQFEKLEERILLTTIQSGEYFLYYDSMGETVRLSLSGGGAIEVFTHRVGTDRDDPTTGTLMDLPGIYGTNVLALQNIEAPYGGVGPNSQAADEFRWDDAPSDPLTSTLILRPQDPNSTAPFAAQVFTVIRANGTNDPMWMEYGDYYPLVQNPQVVANGVPTGTVGAGVYTGAQLQSSDWQQVKRGSRAEIFSIVVLTATMNTILTATTLTGAVFVGNVNTDWTMNINTWNSTQLPLLAAAQATAPIFDNPVSPPALSGGVLIGAVDAPADMNFPEAPRYVGVSTQTTIENVPRIGLFAGGSVSAGIMVSDDIYRIASQTPLGVNVQAVAADFNSILFAVDSSAFHGFEVNTANTGDLGDGINALAASNTGNFFTVDDGRTPTLYGAGATGLVSNSNSVAYDSINKLFYTVDETNQHLIQTDLTGTPTDMGALTYLGQPWRYNNIVGMDVRPGTSEIWAVGSILDPAPGDGNDPPTPPGVGPFLIVLQLPPASAGVVDVQQKVLLSVPPQAAVATDKIAPWPANQVPGLQSIAWSPDGTRLFGVTNGTNQLVEINLTTGVYAPVGWATDAGNPPTASNPEILTVGGVAIPGVIVGIDFIGHTLYGITSQGQLFYLADSAGLNTAAGTVDASTVVMLGSSGTTNVTSLTAGADPHVLFTISRDATSVERLTSFPIYSSLKSVDPVAGTSAPVAFLWDSAQPTFAYDNIGALEYRTDSTGKEALYGIATVTDLDPNAAPAAPAGRWLVMIDTVTDPLAGTQAGRVTRLHQLVGPADLSSIAWDSTDDLFYGVDPTSNELWTLKPTNRALPTAPWTEVNLGVAASQPGITGLEWVNFGTAGSPSPVLFGVDATSLYSIDPATGTCSLLGDTGRVSMTSLAYDPTQPGTLWAVDNVSGTDYRLVEISLSSKLVSVDTTALGGANGGAVDFRGLLFDDPTAVGADPLFVYDNVTAMDFSPGGQLIAVAQVQSLDPLNDPAGGNSWLISIDETTGLVTRLFQLNVASLSTIAFAADGTLYGFNPATASLVTVNLATHTVGNAKHTGVNIVGMDFVGSTLYGVSATALYTINVSTGAATAVPNGVLPTGVSGLASDPSGKLWASWLSGNEYYLLNVFTNTSAAIQDMGRIIIGGTVAGMITNAGNLGVIEVGFLWGGIQSNSNISTVLMREGGGGVPLGNGFASQVTGGDGDSVISADGVVDFVDSRNGARLYTAVEGQNLPGVLPPPWTDGTTTSISELEYEDTAQNFNADWVAGDLVDYTDNTMSTAQTINLDGGTTIRVDGSAADTQDGAVSTALPDGGSYPLDWYALPMLAGQTITVDGEATMMGMYVPLVQHYPNGIPDIRIRLYDSSGHYMDSLGWETEEDWGVGSRPGQDGTQKVMTFTAPSADTYYLVVVHLDPTYYPAYWFTVQGSTPKAVGGVNIVGEYLDLNSGLPGFSVSAKNGGNVGAVMATGNTWGLSVGTIGQGDVYVLQGGELGSLWNGLYYLDAVSSQGNIGRIASTVGFMAGTWEAGVAPAAGEGLQNNNAYIQYMSAKTDLIQTADKFCYISTTGSIGVIDVGGTFQDVPLTLNDDNVGPAAHLDLIDVTGDWGTANGAPLLKRGPNGDIGFVHVGGNIYINVGPVGAMHTLLLTETTLTQGQKAVLNDDGGGQMVVTPVASPKLDSSGNVVLDPTTGLPETYLPSISYAYIGVDDGPFAGSGDGGVIANLRVNGSVNMTSTGPMQISDLDLNYNAADLTYRDINISGTGPVDIYDVETTGTIDSIVNSTTGRLVGGEVAGLGELNLEHGGLGWYVSANTKEWVHAQMNAPVSANTATEPQYGWFDGKINGLDVEGTLGMCIVGGDLGDLRVTGTLGTVVVNADHTRGVNDWDGVKGLVWAGSRIESIDVGNGLADDGGADVAKAGIMSGGSIGTVTISGPRRVINGVVYGELNGSILGDKDTTYVVTNADGSTTTYNQDAIGQVLGTNGAQLTAIVGGLALDSFQASMTTAPVPGGAVGYVRFSGQGALIHGAEVDGTFVREVSDTKETLGMVDTFITGMSAPANGLAVGLVAAGGPGMSNVNVHADGGNIGTLQGLGPVADMLGCTFASSDGINTISARDMDSTTIHAPGLVGTVTMTGDVTNTWAIDPATLQVVPGALVGAFGKVTITGDLDTNWIVVAGVVGGVTVKGEMSNTWLDLRGAAANLKVLDVAGSIGTQDEVGEVANPNQLVFPTEVTSAGQIGAVTSHTGAIYANISTTLGAGATDSDVGSISTAQGFFGQLQVAGSLGKFICTSNLGVNPALYADATSLQIFNIAGNLGTLTVSGTKANPSNLYADFNVGGSIGTISVDGNYYSQVYALGDVGTVKVGGLFGGDPSVGLPANEILTPGNRGSLEALGDIGTLALAKQGDLTANIIAGGNIQSLTVKNGNILGDIISRHGDIMGITVTNGSILGNVEGWNVRSIVVTDGNVSGDVLATDGSVLAMKVTGKKGDPAVGNVLGNVIANNGRIESLTVTNGNLGTPTKALTVSATGGIKSIAVTGGNLYSNVETGGVLDALSVGGTMNNLTIAADGGIKSLTTTGDVNGVTVRSGTTMDKVSIGGASLNSTFSAGWNIGTFATKGNFTSSRLLAGYDVGQDLGTVLLGDGSGSLAAGQSMGVGAGPVAAELVDMNDDGALDLVVVDRAAGTVSVLLGNDTGSFGMRRMYNVGNQPSALAIGDVNGDGIPDVVVANQADNTVSILLGNGDGTLQTQTTLAVGASPVAVALADFDGDGTPDIVTANSAAGGISVSLNDGTGTFAAAVPYATGGTPTALAVGDFDSANGLDIAVADGTGNSVTLLMNNGTGVFVTGATAAVGTDPVSLAVADFDGDGAVDLAVANKGSDNISVFLGDGAGGLVAQAAVALGAGAQPAAIAAADMNGDGNPDLVVLDQGTQRALTLLGGGDGTFAAQPAVSLIGTPTALAVGDVDANGAQDVLAVGQGGGENPFNGGAAHSGNIASVTIGGAMNGSVVSAGMAPAASGLFTSLEGDTPARGYSTIGKMTVKSFANSLGANTVVADSGIDPRFLTAARAAGPALIQVPANADFAPPVVQAPGDFGPGMAGTPKTLTATFGGITFNLTGAGLAHYDAGTDTLSLKGTTSASNLTITYKGVGPAPVVNIVGAGGDDESLGSLKTVGNVALGDLTLDGPIKSITTTTAVSPDALWDLPGGIGTVSLTDASGLNVTAGAIASWTMKGAMATGSLTADSIGTFSTVGNSAANITTGLGALASFSIKGDYSGQIQTFLNVGSLTTTGAFNGVALIARGDLATVKVGTDLMGRIEAARGAIGTVTITKGDFGSDTPFADTTLETAVRSSNGIGTFTVTNGNFYGLVSTDGAIKTVSVAKGDMAGRLRAGGSIGSATFASMTDAIATAGADFTSIKINGDMFGSWVFSGFDPGDAGYNADPAVRDANVQIDFYTQAGYRTAANADRGLGGDIGTFYVKGDMGMEYDAALGQYDFQPCTISAAVDPGADGYCGTSDDLAFGTGYIKKATVVGGIYGDSVAGTTYGFFAASAVPTVTAWKGDPFGGNDNVLVASIPPAVGALEVTGVSISNNAVIVTFNHAINFSTINAQTFQLLVSTNQTFDAAVDPNVPADVPSSFSYNSTDNSVSLTLSGTTTWNTLGLGDYYQLTLDGSRVTDVRSSLLDGEYSGTFPSGDRRPGGNFVYQYAYGQQVLSTVPKYVSTYGTAPTAVAMLAGYYDRMTQFDNIIPGSAISQTANVNALIASLGDGDGTTANPGTPGTGHVPDYAYYGGIDDSTTGQVTPDLSDPVVVASTGKTPHANNCIADFLETSFSYANGGLASNVFGQTQESQIAPGVSQFFGWVDGGAYQATTTFYNAANFTWAIFVQEIDAKRPVLIGIDTTGDGTYDEEVIGVGYDMATKKFAYIDPVDGGLYWDNFVAGPTSYVTITHGVTVDVSLA